MWWDKISISIGGSDFPNTKYRICKDCFRKEYSTVSFNTKEFTSIWNELELSKNGGCVSSVKINSDILVKFYKLEREFKIDKINKK